MVIVDLGIPPGFSVEAGDFAELVGAKRIHKFSVTARQVTLYLGDVKARSVQTFTFVYGDTVFAGHLTSLSFLFNTSVTECPTT